MASFGLNTKNMSGDVNFKLLTWKLNVTFLRNHVTGLISEMLWYQKPINT